MAPVRAGYEARTANGATGSRAAETVWLRRCEVQSQPEPFSSMYVISRFVATSRYRPVTHPHPSVVNPSNLTRLIMAAPEDALSNSYTDEPGDGGIRREAGLFRISASDQRDVADAAESRTGECRFYECAEPES
jgi:hypothetical protein